MRHQLHVRGAGSEKTGRFGTQVIEKVRFWTTEAVRGAALAASILMLAAALAGCSAAKGEKDKVEETAKEEAVMVFKFKAYQTP